MRVLKSGSNKRQEETSRKNIPQISTGEWIRDFKLKYKEIRVISEYYDFGDNIALYSFIYFYLKNEFEDPVLNHKAKGLKKYLDERVFSATNPKRIINELDEFVKGL